MTNIVYIISWLIVILIYSRFDLLVDMGILAYHIVTVSERFFALEDTVMIFHHEFTHPCEITLCWSNDLILNTEKCGPLFFAKSHPWRISLSSLRSYPRSSLRFTPTTSAILKLIRYLLKDSPTHLRVSLTRILCELGCKACFTVWPM
jgi:hypothetical protein